MEVEPAVSGEAAEPVAADLATSEQLVEPVAAGVAHGGAGAEPQDAPVADGGEAAVPKASPASTGGGGELPPWPKEAPALSRALVAGSWTVDADHPFDEARIDEPGLRVAYTRRRAERRMWQGLRGDADHVPLDHFIRDREGPLFAYLYALVQRDVPDPTAPGAFDTIPAVLHVRHRGRARVWYDGELVLDLAAPRDGKPATAAVAVQLTDAFDVILAKLGRGSSSLGMSLDLELRLSGPDGSPLPYQEFNTMRPSHLPPDVPAETLR
jgi:hypothetical protein